MSTRTRSLRVVLAVALLAALAPLTLQAQPTSTSVARDSLRLSLRDALQRGLADAEEIHLADATVEDARQQVAAARSGLFPKIDGRLSYLRTLRTPINTGGGFSLPDSLQFRPDSLGTVLDRLQYLERNTPNAGLGALGSLFDGLPFGRANTYVGTLSLSQTIFDPSLFSGIKIARDFEDAAGAQASEQRLDLGLSIIVAYLDAVLADRQAGIVAFSAVQLADQAEQVRLIRAAGNASDLDVLRVEVDLQNIEPQRVAALNARDVALLNLKRLINVSANQPLVLTELLESEGFQPMPEALTNELAQAALSRRGSVLARELEVKIRGEQISLARGAYFPRVTASANFGKQALPSGLVPNAADFRDDWNAGLAVQIPIFAGGQRKADVERARVQLRTSELQLAQLKESVTLEVEQQRGELVRAAALITARGQTVAQAVRVYDLTNLAYERGQQTSLQLGDARLQLQQARANEAQALHDYYVALARLLRASGVTEAELTDRSIPQGSQE